MILPSARAAIEGTLSADAFVTHKPNGLRVLCMIVDCGVHHPTGGNPYKVHVTLRSYRTEDVDNALAFRAGVRVSAFGRMSTIASIEAGFDAQAKSIVVLDSGDEDADLEVLS
ncbi:MAG: hypothetical protein EBR82_76040 [Caulobacteraceae bacterium]|nr:hypothetical protein [Caulobacteraceae bacterium]